MDERQESFFKPDADAPFAGSLGADPGALRLLGVN